MSKTNKMTCALSVDQISLGIRHLIRVFDIHLKKAWVLSYPYSVQIRLLLDWVDD